MTRAPANPSRAARFIQLGGALLFFAALAYFLFRYFVEFGRPVDGTESIEAAVLWNVALFTTFALHHSVFARTPVRAWMTRHAPASLERSVYVWVASLLFAGTCMAWAPVPGVVWDVEGWPRVVLHALQALGIVLTFISAGALDIGELAGLKPARPIESHLSEPAFKTTGPYGWVRHPIYVGWFLMVLPATPMTMTRFVFAAVSCAYLLVAIPMEERTLRHTSSGGYDDYMHKVRWRLLPGIY